MTGPFRYPDYNQQLGTESQPANTEWSTFLDRRKQLLDEIEGRLALTDMTGDLHGANKAANSVALTNPTSLYNTVTQPPNSMELNELLGAADYYGIKDPGHIPPDALKSIIEAKRLQTRQDNTKANQSEGVLGAPEALAVLGVGALHDLFSVARRVPFIGDAYAKLENTKNAEQEIGRLNEAAMGQVPMGVNEGWFGIKGIKTAGGMVGYALPAGAAWKIAGGLGAASGLGAGMGPIASAAIQGGASAWMLEGGGDDSIQHRVEKVAAGAALGGGVTWAARALGEALPALFNRVQAAFSIPTEYQARATNLAEDAFPSLRGPIGDARGLPGGVRGFLPSGELGTPIDGTTPYEPPSPGPAPEVPGSPANPLVPRDPAVPRGLDPIEQWSAFNDTPAATPTVRVTPPVGVSPIYTAPVPQVSAELQGVDAALSNLQQQRTELLRNDQYGTQLDRTESAITALTARRAEIVGRTAVVAQPETVNAGVGLMGARPPVIVGSESGPLYGPQVPLPTEAGYYADPARVEYLPEDWASANHRFARQPDLSYSAPGSTSFIERPELAPELRPEPSQFNQPTVPSSEEVAAVAQQQGATPEQTNALVVQADAAREVQLQQGVVSPVPLSADNAASLGAAMTKETTIMESPNIADHAAESQIDEATVAEAAMATRPGQIHVLKGVGDVGKVARRMFTERVGAKPMPQDMRLVEVPLPQPEHITSAVTKYLGSEYDAATHAEGLALAKADVARGLEAGSTTMPFNYDYANPEFFRTNTGRVVTREEAYSIAEQSPVPPDRVRGGAGRSRQLFAEGAPNLRGDATITQRTRTDLLVADGRSISNKLVNQYKQFGMFEGQVARAGGGEARVVSPGAEMTTLEPLNGGQKFVMPTREVLAGNGTYTPGHLEGYSVPDEYGFYKDWALHRMNQERASAGLKPVEWLSPEMRSQMQRYLGEFLDANGHTAPQVQAAFEAAFDGELTKEYAGLAPVEMKQTQIINNQLNAAIAETTPQLAPLPIEDIAATKGFIYAHTPGTAGGELIDQLSDLRVPVSDETAAMAFVREFNRQVPDYTPIQDVPVEVMPLHPAAAGSGNPHEPLPRGGEEQYRAVLVRSATSMEELANQAEAGVGSAIYHGSAGGGGGSEPPRLPPGGGYGEGGGNRMLNAGSPPSVSLGQQFSGLNTQGRQMVHEVSNRFDSALLRYFSPMRRVFLKMQEDLQDLGLSRAEAWRSYSDIVTGVTKMHNEAGPWLQEWADLVGNFRSKYKRDGTVVKIEEITNQLEKQRAMDAAGYTRQEAEAQYKIRDFFDRLHGEAGIGNYIFGYIPRVRMRQATGARDPFDDTEQFLPHSIRFFAEHAREGNMQMRQMDIGVLGNTWVRAWKFKQHVAPAWEEMAREWDDPRVHPTFRGIVKEWLGVVRTGANTAYDPMVQGLRQTFNSLGVPVTDAEVHAVWNTIFTNQYRAALGGRPDAVFRDAIQPFLLGTKIGLREVAKTYAHFLQGGGAAKDELYDLGLRGGWLERGQVRAANADMFTQPQMDHEGVGTLSPELQRRREKFAVMGDVIRDMLPARWREGIQGSKYDPLFFYTKLGELNRVISGATGHRIAANALAEYASAYGKLTQVINNLNGANPATARAALEQMDYETGQLRERVLKDSKANLYPQPIRQEFMRLVDGSDFEGAANLMGNEAANSQFRYGLKENPIQVRRAGMVGRMVMQFGTFTTQHAAYFKENLARDIPAADRVKFLARYAAVTGALATATAYTGFNFMKWAWPSSTSWAGGPILPAAARLYQRATGNISQAMGQPVSPEQADAIRKGQDPNTSVAGSLFESLFPYRSTLQTLENYGSAINGAAPWQQAFETTFIGQPNMGPILQRNLNEMHTLPADQQHDFDELIRRQRLNGLLLTPGHGAQQ